ncbi:hypothetical protein CHS0354_034095 [Potamilus streckersoni]|uniref:Uncharacterized protein n=1 Tax=Potamilus streckersoni TaxID=2493646 RepID=A0AAE0TE51_9BIVA|nr:hypothetical protein CHS0354_034095 [Potamilus streckersoni]
MVDSPAHLNYDFISKVWIPGMTDRMKTSVSLSCHLILQFLLAAQMKIVQHLGFMSLYHPGFASIQQCHQHNSFLDLKFCLHTVVSVIPHICTWSAKAYTCLSNSGIGFFINNDCT